MYPDGRGINEAITQRKKSSDYIDIPDEIWENISQALDRGRYRYAAGATHTPTSSEVEEEIDKAIEKYRQSRVDLLQSEEGREKLAQEFILFLESDDSEPISHRNQWFGEKALRNFEMEAVQKRGLYAEFAGFCAWGIELATTPAIKALFVINRINGMRRITEGERNDPLIEALFDEAKFLMTNIKETPRKSRLLSLLSYNAGEYSSVSGNYTMAAEYSEYSAALAEASGDKSSAAISRFTAKLKLVYAALVKNEGIHEALADLRQARNHLSLVLTDASDLTSATWMFLNTPIHMITAHFLGGEAYNSEPDYRRLNTLVVTDPELAKNHESTIAIPFAIREWNRGNFTKAFELAVNVIDGHFNETPAPEYLATVLLLLAKDNLRRSDYAEDANLGAEFKRHGLDYLRKTIAVEGSHQVRAIAKRKLNALLKE